MKINAGNFHIDVFKFIKIALGFVLLFMAFRNIEWSKFREAINNVNCGWLLAAIFSVLVGLAIKVLRWFFLLRNYGIKFPLFRLVSAYFIGQAANIVMFVRGGEILRIGWAHGEGKDDLMSITATIAIEKYLDLLMLVGLMTIITAGLPNVAAERLDELGPWLAVISIILFSFFLIGPWFWKNITSRLKLSGWAKTIKEKIDRFIEVSLWLRNPVRLISAFGISIVIWVTMALTNIFLFLALDINPGWLASGLVLVLVYIGVLPALMPGNIGPFTYFAQLALKPFEVGDTTGLAFAILLFGIVTLPPLLIAGLMLLIPGNRKNYPE